jgi:acyl-CoA synthetase (AMP-forming)/AMP-acid ligase II
LAAQVGVLPFYHIYGLTVIMNVALCSGAAVVTIPKFDPALFLQAHDAPSSPCPTP